MALKDHILSLISPPERTASPGIGYFRDRLVFYLLAALAVFGFIAYIPSVYYGWLYEFYSVIFIDTIALAWVVFLLWKRDMAFPRKTMGLLAVFFMLGVWLLVVLGPTGAGFMWLLVFSVMAGVILGRRPALVSFLINLATVLVLGALVANQTLTWKLIPSDELAIWTIKAVNFICINAILSVSTGFLITQITRMAKSEKERRRNLDREIQARTRAEQENRSLTEQLYQSQKMEAMGTLAGGIAHDFNNLLGIIKGYAELSLMSPKLPEDARENIGHINRAGERASEITRQILTFSRQQPSDKADTDLGRIARESVQFFKIGIPREVRLSVDIPADPFPVFADKTQIFQIIINLLTNGLQALEPGKDWGGPSGPQSEIRLSVGYWTPDGDSGPAVGGAGTPSIGPGHVCLQVADTGKGIPRENLSLIFDPYFTTKKIDQGTGMGLAISHGIVKEHGGDIRVESTPGRGSRFTVVLPLGGTGDQAGPEAHIPAGGGETILMVEDDPQVLNVQKRFLTSRGYRILDRTDPLAALDILKDPDQQVDLLITDLKMPGMSGNDLRARLHRIRPEVPAILCSGFPDPETVSGFARVLPKPVSASDLAGAVRSVLDDR